MTKTIAVSAAGRPVGEDSARCRWGGAARGGGGGGGGGPPGRPSPRPPPDSACPSVRRGISSDAAAGPCCRPVG